MAVRLFAPALDKQAPPTNVRALHDDLAAKEKVLVDLACASTNVPPGLLRLGY